MKKKDRNNYCEEATNKGKKRKSNTDRTNRDEIKAKNVKIRECEKIFV